MRFCSVLSELDKNERPSTLTFVQHLTEPNRWKKVYIFFNTDNYGFTVNWELSADYLELITRAQI